MCLTFNLLREHSGIALDADNCVKLVGFKRTVFATVTTSTHTKKKILAEWKKWFHLFLLKRLFKIVNLKFKAPGAGAIV